ncbi:FxSxx-COOH system tetratricopeptide repeat protein [Streptomyces iconiensis]|uniref:FxSxx-COOH system tetratricopeptide repeat protein n=1 Tax=Streptomyces iconiensis TaxID=1384038 RepID=A0ABT7A1S0_9ACTN|nr:FxSxx-COOH system tetratricopeptide repeat protein [Streptomyces iconiensis]MDJ1135261.1 FxSxx-COOH system tetratricopeptide repeat protein [Streptomyces iconiensis]
MVAQREPAQSGPPGQESEHFVVVFPGYHRAWGSWIAHKLENHGHRTTLQRWDPDREQPLEEALGDLQLATGRVVLVISDLFFQLGPRTETDWSSVLRGFVSEHAGEFAAVNLTNRELLPATAVLEPVNLWGVGEDEAERRLLNRLGLRPRRLRNLPPAGSSRYPNEPPAVWGEVPRRNARFTGRDVILGDLQQQLMDAEHGAAVCTLVGTAGIGKTQIAAEYAHRFAPDYDVVWWVNCDQRNTQREAFSSLAGELGLGGVAEVGERVRAVRDTLRRNEPSGRWLLIFDGWEEPEDAITYLPQGGTGHVLITSRNQNWRSSTDIKPITAFRRAESTGYLMRGAPHISVDQADQVASEFQDLPLQLAQAAAWLGQEGMEVPEYLRMVRGVGLTRLESHSMPDDYPVSSLTSWSILLNKLRKSEPRAVELLSLCAVFAPGRIPLGLARGIPGAELPDQMRWISSDGAGWARALDSLVSYSVLTRESRGPAGDGEQEDSVHIHQVVHSVISELTGGRKSEVYRDIVHRLLVEADPGAPNDSRQWPRYAELIPHLLASEAHSSREGRVQEMLLNCLRYCYTSGEYTLGAELAEAVREKWEEFLDVAGPRLGALTTQQGNLLRLAGRFREAQYLDTFRRDRLLEIPGADEEALVEATSCLAADLRPLGQYEDALKLQQEVVETTRRLYGPEERTSLLAQHNLAVGLRLLGRYEDAYDVDLDTLRKREQVLRARHPNTLSSGNACARDLRLMGRYQEALARQELGMRLHLQVLGPQHPQTLLARHNLLLCQRRAGTSRQDMATAMASLLDQQEQVHGRRHYSTLALLTDYGNFLREHGDLSQARELLTEAEEGFRRLLGPAHPVSTAMQSNAGLVLQAEGERDGALNMFEQALAGLTSLLGADHPATLGCALNTSGGRNLSEALDDAFELSRDTFERARETLGADHPLTLSCMVANAADLRGLRRRDEARAVEAEVLERLTRSLGAQHHHTLSARQRTRPYWDYEPYLG